MQTLSSKRMRGRYLSGSVWTRYTLALRSWRPPSGSRYAVGVLMICRARAGSCLQLWHSRMHVVLFALQVMDSNNAVIKGYHQTSSIAGLW